MAPAVDVFRLLSSLREPARKIRALLAVVEVICRCVTAHRAALARARAAAAAATRAALTAPRGGGAGGATRAALTAPRGGGAAAATRAALTAPRGGGAGGAGGAGGGGGGGSGVPALADAGTSLEAAHINADDLLGLLCWTALHVASEGSWGEGPVGAGEGGERAAAALEAAAVEALATGLDDDDEEEGEFGALGAPATASSSLFGGETDAPPFPGSGTRAGGGAGGGGYPSSPHPPPAPHPATSLPALFADVALMADFAGEAALIERPGFFLTSLQAALLYAMSPDIASRIACGHCEAAPPARLCRACGRQLCGACDALLHPPLSDEERACGEGGEEARALARAMARHVRVAAPRAGGGGGGVGGGVSGGGGSGGGAAARPPVAPAAAASATAS
jgi:hypothetical protein